MEATIWRLPSLIQLLISTKSRVITRLIGGVGCVYNRLTHCEVIFCRLKYDHRMEILVARSKEGNSYTIVGYINYCCGVYSLEKTQIMDFLWYILFFLLCEEDGYTFYSIFPYPPYPIIYKWVGHLCYCPDIIYTMLDKKYCSFII